MLNKKTSIGLQKLQKITKKVLNHLWSDDVLYGRTAFVFLSKIYKQLKIKLITMKKHAFDASVLALVMVVGGYVLFPSMANADILNQQNGLDHKTVSMVIASMQNETKSFGTLPVAVKAAVRKTYTIPITAYTSEVGQTDNTPCITASGLDLCKRNQEDIVAANFLPIGTRVRIPEFYGDRIFTVQDRMNARYDHHMDIWMKSLPAAKQFGLKTTTIEVF